jgi:hypothetical protein
MTDTDLKYLKQRILDLEVRVRDLETRQCPNRYIDAAGRPMVVHPESWQSNTTEPTGEVL